MSAERRRKHIADLVKELDVDFKVGVSDGLECLDGFVCGYSYTVDVFGMTRFGRAVVSEEPGHSLEAYLVALHELGHLATGFRGPRGWRWRVPFGQLESEARAWRWAVVHAAELGREAWEIIGRHLDTYVTGDRRVKPSTQFDRMLQIAACRASY